MKTTSDKEFEPYGYPLKGDYSSIVDYLTSSSPMPKENNLYVRDEESFRALDQVKTIQEEVFGFGQIEAGYCNGYNSKLNALEAHACPEVDIAATDLILLLALPSDIENGKIDVSKVASFYVKKGEAVVLRPYTFHFSPCKVVETGFKCAIILSDGTNMDLPKKPSDPRLFKVNKWLFAHPEAKQASMGAYIGISGKNIEVPWAGKK